MSVLQRSGVSAAAAPRLGSYLSGSCVPRRSRLASPISPPEVPRRPVHAGSQTKQRRWTSCAASQDSAGSTPYPYKPEDYYRIGLALMMVHYSRHSAGLEGTLVLMRQDESGAKLERNRGMLLVAGGDTLTSITAQRAGTPHERPCALELLWTVLGRGKEVSNKDWVLLRVAIVDLRKNIFIGRLFFGDAETGAVVWDCDCRPSDALWLAERSKAPLFVHHSVWARAKTTLDDISALMPQDVIEGKQLLEDLISRCETPLQGISAWTTPRREDPEPVKRLKMEMKVALREEDYAAAARIRDHPFMQLAMEVLSYRQIGADPEADKTLSRLMQQCEEQAREPAKPKRLLPPGPFSF